MRDLIQSYKLHDDDKDVLVYMQKDLKLNTKVIMVLYEMILALNDRITPNFTQQRAIKWSEAGIETVKDAYKQAIKDIEYIIDFRRKRTEEQQLIINDSLNSIERKVLMLLTLRNQLDYKTISEVLDIPIEFVDKIVNKLAYYQMAIDTNELPMEQRFTSVIPEYRDVFKIYDEDYKNKIVDTFDYYLSQKKLMRLW
ncbi:DnaD domain protein [Priestia aryabhattai]|uniref:DnaD domain protein n=1 Tax=Priestia aryabhattai TaxID=412384 RepID=UPI001ECF7A7F|nr:DnaD domain protein [Priestia aryabhattai]MBY0094915.1 DnaD domain protein [Priestia aryabhattai]MBY0105597.1 DnaD domain protein [Priestia aryabhattai]